MLWLLTGILAAMFAVITVKWIFLKKEISLMAKTIMRIHGKNTNERLTVSSRDKHVLELANAVNGLYDDIAFERAEYINASATLRQSIADISHDLRTPLTSIIGYVRLLENGSPEKEQQAHYLSIVSSKAQSLHHLVDGLFTLTRLEVGEYPLDVERVDMREILSEELAGFYDAFTANGQDPRIMLGSMPIWVIGDRQAFSRIFQNLLQNMAKHRAVDISITAGCKENIAEFVFSNRAENLTRDDLPDLFRRFFTADRMRSGENTGLGLAIVKAFVEQTGGNISAGLDNGVISFTLRWKRA